MRVVEKLEMEGSGLERNEALFRSGVMPALPHLMRRQMKLPTAETLGFGYMGSKQGVMRKESISCSGAYVYPDQENGGNFSEKHQGQNTETHDYLPAVMGMKIRQRRKARGWTQNELGQRMHLSSTTISRIEGGKTYLDVQKINQLCKELGCTVTDIWPDESVIQKQTTENEILIRELRKLLEKFEKEE